jgi:DNA-binding MarR family transcriptional regulator
MSSSSARLQTVFDALIRAETEVWSDVDDRMVERCGTPLARFEPLRVIASMSGCRVADVADALSITRGGASKLVERLRSDGLCDRVANPADGRSWFFVLTPAGTGVLEAARSAFDIALDERLGGRLGATALGQLESLLHALRRSTTSHEREEPVR